MDAYMYYNPNIMSKYKYVYVSHPRHASARVGSRGSAMWPCVPRRIHVSHTKINPLFILFLIILNDLNSKINSEKSKKIPKN